MKEKWSWVSQQYKKRFLYVHPNFINIVFISCHHPIDVYIMLCKLLNWSESDSSGLSFCQFFVLLSVKHDKSCPFINCFIFFFNEWKRYMYLHLSRTFMHVHYTKIFCTTIFEEKTDFLSIPIFSSRHFMSAGKTLATQVFV